MLIVDSSLVLARSQISLYPFQTLSANVSRFVEDFLPRRSSPQTISLGSYLRYDKISDCPPDFSRIQIHLFGQT